MIWPKKIKSNYLNWKKRKHEVYIDFETFSDVFAPFTELPVQRSTNIIFMIGVGWVRQGIWNYKSFICKEPTKEEEYRIMNEFVDFIKTMNKPVLNYWHAEKQIWNKAANKHFETTEDDIDYDVFNTWFDVCALFKLEPIVLKDCFSFGLKEIARTMRKYDMINCCIESECDSGMTAMVKAYEAYNSGINIEESPIMRDIEKYNQFDCKVLWEILTYLRNNHI